MRKLTIFCDGGLGNRFGVLIGGLLTAKKLNVSPVICWPENNWCGCSFDDLFDTEIPIISDDINKLFNNNLDKIFLIHENQTGANLIKTYHHTTSSLDTIYNLTEDIIYYHNRIPNYFSSEEIISELSNLKIKSIILDEVKRFCTQNRIDKNTIGVHFRKTDVPIGLDEHRVYETIFSNNKIQHYICSDDEKTESTFKKLKNVIVYPKSSYVEKYVEGGWNDVITDAEGRRFNFNVNRPKQSVIEAFVDLLILSRTRISVNSVSSFLNFAKLYSNINL